MQTETGKLSVREKVGYSLGDGAANFIFQTFMLLQLSFYTDTMYIRDKVSSVTRPVKELRGFKRISLKAGETKMVSFGIDPEKLAIHNIEMNYVVEPGIFEIMTGSSSRDIDLQMTELSVES